MASKKNHSVGGMLKDTFANIGRVLAALLMVGIITGCIVASVLTVYVLRYINSDEQLNLEDFTLKYTTIIYAQDPQTGEPYELQRLQTAENRIPVPLDQIPDHMVDALIAIEDKRFMEHQGVDWKRTFGAFVNMFIPIYSSQQGGSTITQQLIKNMTGDDDLRVERKVQEIFRALNLEKRYSKEQILEAYLNTVYYSNSAYGVQAAANTYFRKDVSELTLAESAAIIGITQFPGKYDPFVNPEHNKKRQEQVLFQMLDQKKIMQEEYDQAVAEELHFQRDAAYAGVNPTYSYFVDHVIEEVIADLMAEKGYTYEFAQRMVNGGGYRIYATVDQQMQQYVEDFYSDAANFPQTVLNEEYPQSACVITDPNGKLLALAGGIGEKKGMREFDRATQSFRQCGSAIKPIAAYLQAFENDIITWSTVVDDHPITIKDEATGQMISWPVNFQRTYEGPMTIDKAIQQSRNTIPAQLVKMMGEKRVFNFLHDKLGMKSLIDRQVINGQVMSDINLSGMALGGLTHGVTPLEMAGAYQIFANGGYYTDPYAYTKVLDANGDVILEKDTTSRRVISAETATVLNKLLQRVTAGPWGTGTPAKFSAMPVAGKTGTSTDDKDQWFMGVTPYYVSAFWLGYDEPERIRYTYYPPPLLYKSVMGKLHEGLEIKQFPAWGDVVEQSYCVESGELALETCPTTAVGWYKKSYQPGTCTLHSGLTDSQDLDEMDDRERSSSRTTRKSKSGLTIIENQD